MFSRILQPSAAQCFKPFIRNLATESSKTRGASSLLNTNTTTRAKESLVKKIRNWPYGEDIYNARKKDMDLLRNIYKKVGVASVAIAVTSCSYEALKVLHRVNHEIKCTVAEFDKSQYIGFKSLDGLDDDISFLVAGNKPFQVLSPSLRDMSGAARCIETKIESQGDSCVVYSRGRLLLSIFAALCLIPFRSNPLSRYFIYVAPLALVGPIAAYTQRCWVRGLGGPEQKRYDIRKDWLNQKITVLNYEPNYDIPIKYNNLL